MKEEDEKDEVILDGEKYIPFRSDCTMCDHFNDDIYSCVAFPNGIPLELLRGDIHHKTVLATQTGDYISTFISS